jgi:hypothetical protein
MIQLSIILLDKSKYKRIDNCIYFNIKDYYLIVNTNELITRPASSPGQRAFTSSK